MPISIRAATKVSLDHGKIWRSSLTRDALVSHQFDLLRSESENTSVEAVAVT
jgi:hypothetical protein